MCLASIVCKTTFLYIEHNKDLKLYHKIGPQRITNSAEAEDHPGVFFFAF